MIDSALIPIACPWDGIPEWPRGQKKLLGWTLLKRTVFQLQAWAVKRVYLLHQNTDHHAVRALMSDPQVQKLGIDLVPVVLGSNPDTALDLPTGPFLLAMDGVVFNPGCGDRVRILTLAPKKSMPLVDNRSSGRFTGLALCSPDRVAPLISYCRQAWQSGHGRGIMPALFPPALSSPEQGEPCSAIVLDSRRARCRAEGLLLDRARKPSDGFVAAHFNRHISLFISKYLLRMGITPMPVTLVNLLFSLASGWFLFQGGHLNSAIGGLLFQFSSIFDGCDGEIARINHRSTEAGAKLDNLCDIASLLIVGVTLPIGVFRATGSPVYLWFEGVILITAAVYYLVSGVVIRRLDLRGNRVQLVKAVEKLVRKNKRSGLLDRLTARMIFIMRHDFIAALACVLLLADGGAYVVILFTILTLYQAGYITVVWWRLKKEERCL